MGITRSSYYGYINGNPTVEVLQRIADALDVELSELFLPPDPDFYGVVLYKGQMYKINDLDDYMELTKKVFDDNGLYIGKL